MELCSKHGFHFFDIQYYSSFSTCFGGDPEVAILEGSSLARQVFSFDLATEYENILECTVSFYLCRKKFSGSLVLVANIRMYIKV